MNHQKFELKVDLAKLDVEVDKTSIFKVQMRIIGVFKVFSKKYQITQPEEFVNSTKKFHGQVEFRETDNLVKVIAVPKTSSGEFGDKIVLIEVLQDEVIVSTNEINLKDYVDLDQELAMNLP